MVFWKRTYPPFVRMKLKYPQKRRIEKKCPVLFLITFVLLKISPKSMMEASKVCSRVNKYFELCQLQSKHATMDRVLHFQYLLKIFLDKQKEVEYIPGYGSLSYSHGFYFCQMKTRILLCYINVQPVLKSIDLFNEWLRFGEFSQFRDVEFLISNS